VALAVLLLVVVMLAVAMPRLLLVRVPGLIRATSTSTAACQDIAAKHPPELNVHATLQCIGPRPGLITTALSACMSHSSLFAELMAAHGSLYL
jgi:hypothetical protein